MHLRQPKTLSSVSQIVAIFAACGLLLLPATAKADDPFTFAYEAKIGWLGDSGTGALAGVTVGDTLKGVITQNSSVPDEYSSDPEASFRYHTSPYRFGISGFTGSHRWDVNSRRNASADMYLTVVNSSYYDEYWALGNAPAGSNNDRAEAEIWLLDETATAFTSKNLPTQMNANDFASYKEVKLSRWDSANNEISVGGNVTSITAWGNPLDIFRSATDRMGVGIASHLASSPKYMEALLAPETGSGVPVDPELLAASIGYDSFRWVQYVTQDPYPLSDSSGQTLQTPYLDPPIDGYLGNPDDTLPYYFDLTNTQELLVYDQGNAIKFYDAPRDYRLTGTESIDFLTLLVGAYDTGVWDALYGFEWSSNVTGSGGSVGRKTLPPPEPGGTGGVSLTQLDIDFRTLDAAIIAQIGADGGSLVPEPGSIALLVSLVLTGVGVAGWRRWKSK